MSLTAGRGAAPRLVLASSSPYRAELLGRLGLRFVVDAARLDETRRSGETGAATASRLARHKALAVAERHPGAIIIGSDQVATLGERHLGKPGSFENALAQLQAQRGREVEFFTALCVLDTASGRQREATVTTRVRFRDLPDAELEAYLHREAPYDCAGSAKVEGLGIALLERVDSDDPSALIGLPLIRLVTFLRELGVPLLAAAPPHP